LLVALGLEFGTEAEDGHGSAYSSPELGKMPPDFRCPQNHCKSSSNWDKGSDDAKNRPESPPDGLRDSGYYDFANRKQLLWSRGIRTGRRS
ncbi:MAG TPA: hypothetical protein PLA50_15805, partial [Bacteroidia bacterium]|nr:hypothetical protein [Bacteroidia bacterium]